MMQTQPLPTCNEYDPLDAHLDELEEPDSYFLQDFIMTSCATQSDTPLSNSNGYTSEESDYSVVTPTDKQYDKDVSFLPIINTSELVDVIGDLRIEDLTAVDSKTAKGNHFAGKIAKGKTSKYRGVTQTSKTSWGAKYSAKRITNTCKTPEEAAHAYDEYLKTHYPQKFAKFANFCFKCDKFVNPLGLPQFQSECTCPTSSPVDPSVSELDSVSPKKEIFNSQEMTTPTSTPSLAPPMAPSPAGGPSTLNTTGASNQNICPNPVHEENTIQLSRRSSNMSVSSLKFSFSEDTERFFAESFNEVSNMSSDHCGAALSDTEQQQQEQTRDSLSMTVISSAGDSFTQEGNLDQIIKDIHRPSLSLSVMKENIVEESVAYGSVSSFAATGCSSESEKTSQLDDFSTAQIEPPTSNLLNFGNDLDELTEYFLSENDAVAAMQREMHSNLAYVQHNPTLNGAQVPQFRKIHSLDFDSDNAVTSSSRNGIEMSGIKLEDTQMTRSTMAESLNVRSNLAVPLGSPQPAIIDIQTQFLEKYWRNDRKNIQCFPYCPEHGDYYRVRIENLQHRCKGVCHAPVKARISIPSPAGASVAQTGLLVLARCNSTFSRNMALMEQQNWSLNEIKLLQSVSAIGTIEHFAPLGSNLEGVQFDVTFYPDVWKFEFDLPKKRRHVQASSLIATSQGPDCDSAGDSLAAEFLYFFEIDVFYSREKTTFERLGHVESINFQIGNTRTLLRQRNKMVGEGPSTLAGPHDGDRLENTDELPEKKKVKVYLGQREMLSGTTLSDDGTLSGRGLAKSRLSIGYITGDGISSSSKQNMLNDKTKHIDVDGFFRTDSKDSLFNREVDTSDLPDVKSDVWKDVDDDMQEATSNDYRSYLSPKQMTGYVQSMKSPIASAAPVKPNTGPAVPNTPTTIESYSLSKLLQYSLECVAFSMLFIPVGFLLLLGILAIPPASSGIVSTLDSLSDMELSRANSCCISRDRRFVLKRLLEEKPNGGLFRYHVKSEVWRRLLYFTGAKLVVSMVSSFLALMLTLFVGLFYPIRPVSVAIANAACRCALWSREYTRETTGKPLASVATYDNLVGLV